MQEKFLKTKIQHGKKLKSTISKSVEPENCPVTLCLKVIGGKWKPVIIFLVKNKVNRFGALQRAIPAITKQMLTSQLRDLEMDGVIDRKIFTEVPPKVEYSLTGFGETLLPIIEKMKDWGEFASKSNSKAAKRIRKENSSSVPEPNRS
jgi:DNA-binding HxlR family transcriptional regulator